jgi:basic membrane protein A
MFAVLLAGAFTLSSCQAAETTFKVAMVTDVGDIDDKSFNQGTWEGIVEWAEENDVSHKYYRPTADEDDARLAAIDLAVAGGAEIVVTPGFMFEVVIYTAQTKYPDVKFVLIDGAPHAGDYATYETTANTKSILFKENESGFLAGYASVMEGYRELGFMGGIAVPAVVRFGLGYIAGAYHAARELGATTWEFNPAYYEYLGGFAPDDSHKAKAASWYTAGVEIIHAAAGGAGNSVMAAAEESMGGMVVGVDVDQSAQSSTVVTSAMKALGVVVQQALTEWKAGSFEGGETVVLGAAEEAVALPLGESFRFTTFTEAQYAEILGKLVDGTVAVPFTVDELGTFLTALGVGEAQVAALKAAVSGE